MSASWALQRAVYAALSADAVLSALLGGAHLYDDVPRGAAVPYVSFGRWVSRERGTAATDGEEHRFELNVWSRGKGHREAQQIVGAVRTALHDGDLTLSGYTLVNLQVESTEVRRERDGESYRGIVRLRAMTEPL